MGILIALGIIAVVLVLFWLWAIAPQMGNKPNLKPFHQYDYAHRGLHRKEDGVPENSLLAFRLAADCGFGMELDLQLTKDGQVVVHHDNSILRSCGADKYISDLTYEELCAFRLFGTEEQIPLFSQVLQLVEGKTPMIVELKGYNDPETLCKKAMELLDGYKGLYCVESFDPRIVRWFKVNRPEIVRGQLMEYLQKGVDGLTGAQAFFGRNMMTNYLTRPNFEAYDFTRRNNLSLRAARLVFGMQEVSWTLRTIEDFCKAKNDGCLCIFEGILPAPVEDEKKDTLEALLQRNKAVALAEIQKILPSPKAES